MPRGQSQLQCVAARDGGPAAKEEERKHFLRERVQRAHARSLLYWHLGRRSVAAATEDY